jgi:hypothetical protein
MRRRKRLAGYLAGSDTFDRPPPRDERGGRLLAPFDLPAGVFVLCGNCAATTPAQRCEDCPRQSTALYRALNRPPWWRRLLGGTT